MTTTLAKLLLIASTVPSSTYGWGEKNCGDIGMPRACAEGAITASGEVFTPTTPSVAIAAPTRFVLIPRYIGIALRDAGGRAVCVRVRLNDKMNPRYIGVRGFDLTPAAVKLVTGEEPTPQWSGHVTVCEPDSDPVWDHNVQVDLNKRMGQWLRDWYW